jgi:uncharacterized protein YsxB (DUF464 family)
VITVEVVLGSRGNLISAAASGHAGKGILGMDIVCAAVTVLLRTTLAVLAGRDDVRGGEAKVSSSEDGSVLAVKAETAGRGQLAFRVTAFSETDIPFLEYAAVFLQEGLASLVREYPDAVAMRVTRKDLID